MRSADSNIEASLVDRRLADEQQLFIRQHPRSQELFAKSERTLLRGVPMSWMSEWHGGFPVFLAEAHGAELTDVDGITYADFCMGDTAAMAGHTPAATVKAVNDRVRRGSTAMLPTEDAVWVGSELARRFGLPIWQFSLSATDANRWILRLARALTGRQRIMVFDGCYHGTVDETVVALDPTGHPISRKGNIGHAFDPASTTEVAEFNDLESVERILICRQVACVLTEPALTNAEAIVRPSPDFHAGLRALTQQTGTYLAIDETQTFPNGPGGCTQEMELRPDFLTIGKAIAGGIPLGAYGMTEAVADLIRRRRLHMGDVGAVGGTLAGNALSMAAARATLGEVLHDQVHRQINLLGRRVADGIDEVIRAPGLPWHVVRLGSRVEFRYLPEPPVNARQAMAAADPALDAYLHLSLLNRGVVMTPFHNMALISAATNAAHVDSYLGAFTEAVAALIPLSEN